MLCSYITSCFARSCRTGFTPINEGLVDYCNGKPVSIQWLISHAYTSVTSDVHTVATYVLPESASWLFEALFCTATYFLALVSPIVEIVMLLPEYVILPAWNAMNEAVHQG
ncbi:hypothetical protein AAVH_21499 [Aphelenchoides avenae]|nr:hypothetical protein AAVH_21499 [Aphelenchus avenae]